MQTKPNNQSNSILESLTTTSAETIAESINATIIAPALNLGIAGLKFSIGKSESLELSSDITDFFLEDNTSVQQHISNKPKRLTLTGEIHEISLLSSDNSFAGELQSVTEKMTVVTALLPAISASYQSLRNIISDSSSGISSNSVNSDNINSAINLYSLYKNVLSLNTEQGRITQFITAIHNSKIGIGIDTRVGYFTDMYIESARISARDNTSQISDVEITVKQLRFSNTQIVAFDPTQYASKVQKQQNPNNLVGKSNATPVSDTRRSIIKDLWTQ